jgi:DNA-binding response OmpR family regulator
MVVDDEERIRTVLCRLMATQGHSTVAATDGDSALQRLRESDVDLVLLDLAMPRTNGLQLLAALADRRPTPPPVIVLSAVTDVAARVKALDLGAVDFVSKPFHSAELVARVRRNLAQTAATRTAPTEAGPRPTPRYLEGGGIRLDLDRRRARVHDVEVTLTEREFGLLAHLMRRRGDVCTRSELLHDVWGLDFDPGSNVVEVCVRRLRTKLLDPPIETIRSVGYCFDGGGD